MPRFRAGLGLTLILLAVSSSPGLADDPPEILLSRQVMEARDLEVGDLVRLSANPDGSDARSFRVAGRFEPVPNPMLITESRFEVRLHLPDLQALTDSGKDRSHTDRVTRINVRLANPEDAGAFSREIGRKVPATYAYPSDARSERARAFEVLRRFHWAIAIVTVVGSTAFLLALMVMRAEERRETVGILRLIGFSKRGVLVEVFLEGLFVAITGAFFGILLAVVSEDTFNRFFQWYYDTPLVFMHVTPRIVAQCIAIAVPLGIVAGVGASWTLLRREILELLRR